MLGLSYLGLTLATVIVLLYIGLKAINSTFKNTQRSRRKKIVLISSLLIWQLYLYLIGSGDFLTDYRFPPRFFVFMILPSFIFTGVFIYKNRNAAWLQHIPPHWLLFYQSFRVLIETIFFFSVAAGVLNKEVTIEGYNYDMIYGFTAILIGLLVFRKKPSALKIAYWWNFLGLGIIAFIIFLFNSSIYFPKLYGSDDILLPSQAGQYPYTLVAGFLMPSAVFIHVLSVVQIRQLSSNRPFPKLS